MIRIQAIIKMLNDVLRISCLLIFVVFSLPELLHILSSFHSSKTILQVCTEFRLNSIIRGHKRYSGIFFSNQHTLRACFVSLFLCFVMCLCHNNDKKRDACSVRLSNLSIKIRTIICESNWIYTIIWREDRLLLRRI